MSDKPKLLGLTLHRPWAALIAAGIKRIENRSWHPAARMKVGEWFAVHAGKGWDNDCMTLAAKLGTPIGWFSKPRLVESAIVAVCRYDGFVEQSESPWFFGPFGWKLGEVTGIEPVPCKGAQGLWDVPPAIAEQVRAAYRAAKVAPAGLWLPPGSSAESAASADGTAPASAAWSA